MSVKVHEPHRGIEDGWEFDYGALSPSAARFLQEQAREIIRTSANSVIQIGRDLIAAKHYLDHGVFLRWVEAEIGMRPRTAQAYMQVANWVSGKSATVAHLPPSVLYLLSAARTPEQYIYDILKRIEAGENVALTVVRDELKALRKHRKSDDQPEGRCCDNDEGKTIAPSDPDLLMEVVTILAQVLPKLELARVRHIMTDDSVLHDPALARRIADAFSRIPSSTKMCDAAPHDKRPVDPLCSAQHRIEKP